MKKQKYQVTVYEYDKSFGVSGQTSPDYTGEFRAETKEQAIKDAKDFYAYELDTLETNIRVENIKAI